jgi:hypothetical protein
LFQSVSDLYIIFLSILIEHIIDISMSLSTLHRLTEEKSKQLSKFLGIDSVPSTQLIANMQSRINNPLFKLSMTDYEDMCSNKMMTKMMSKVIGCEEKQLKKFCKYINVFAENIESSPKSIKNKMKVRNSINASMRRGSLNILPDDILEKIVKKYKTIFKIKYKLKDWIPKKKLNWNWLSSNPNAIELLKNNPKKIDWGGLSENPNPEAIELLKEKINEENEIDKEYLKKLPSNKKIGWGYLSANPNAIELLKANHYEEIDWYLLSKNPSPAAIELLKKNRDNIHWGYLSENTNSEAIELLRANPTKIYWPSLSKNPEAIELLKENLDELDEIDWKYLSINPHPTAIELLKNNTKKIDWDKLSENPNPEAIELLKKNLDKINWSFLSENPSAIELLKTNQKKIYWDELSSNPNPAAIELLKENKTKINWDILSKNPAIFDEILE